MAEFLHAGLGWSIASTLTALSFFTFSMTAAFGIGGTAVMLAVLATLLPAAAIPLVHGFVQLGSNAGRATIMWRHLRREIAPMFLAGAVIGIALGSVFLVQLDPAILQIALGSFIL
ncbi:hypothetical protein Dshi_2536 [Dinoroseobacter shibae DFL 12 = DSM 16493]|jgi:uncharacterized membrane protein YfcA|uniref:Probable membrane transporter protein n=1 Tax=Dinoroseobacter shibae (strain DSM 16493 / NCIMB 14021 / DFL 12) TaxID=398580 RepID=A8LSS0_DINSH|nr:TSUP family transporter [Dinoroseobacter shibae]ABV94269.1 hypothetical protein Dshi_2536 [Dinoroseobacter shibae DFL 12 = DSM 16493]URF45706.1 TSUP family transporter [Dinoroseobacter shibae]URF50011.1 TSUP family transporter [Dinoroseobacter shibae]